MKLTKYLSACILLTIAPASAFSQEITESAPNYYNSRNDFLSAPASVYDQGLIGFSNPANLAFLKSPEHRFFWSSEGTDASSFGNWGLFNGWQHLGFGLQRREFGEFRVMDYKISIGGGTKAHAVGISYGWSTGDNEIFKSEKILSFGSIMRPFPFISLGLLGNLSLESDWNEGIAELGIRPLGNSKLTIFADASIQKEMKIEDAPWSAGAVVEIVDGINLIGRYFDNETFTFGFSINFGKSGIGARTKYDSEQNHTGYNYHIRAGGMRPSIFPAMINKDEFYLPIQLKGRIDYNKYAWFDTGTIRFMDLLKNIKAAAEDTRIGVIALNLSSMRIRPEHAWEIREELRKAREHNKKVIIFFDRVGMTGYHLASIADQVVMDPEGSIELYGYVSGKTYFKGTLEKLGLGFDEWRFYKYKSAAEILSRDSFSEPDREQYRDWVNDRYEHTRSEICDARMLSFDQFDNLVDTKTYFMAPDVLEAGLVDTLARWSDKDKIIALLGGKNYQAIDSSQILANANQTDTWGAPPKIAVVYGLGECAMDTGIRARWLEGVFLKLRRDYSVKAVVFRVDSPGGDGMASDLVAIALKKCAEVKPVIISQGQVAGSGGYWISMYGHKILAGPNTITGSIGVIGGWVYDKGIGEKIGFSSDFVKRGKHADLGFGIRIPFLNITVPARNLTPEERTEAEKFIKQHYEVFVAKVAEGRNMTIEKVKEIAEGHFYSGTRGKENGLVDEIGGLMDAIAIAVKDAGLKDDDEYEIIEIPRSKGWFNLRSKISPISAEVEDDAVINYLKMLTKHPGRPLPMLIPGTYPTWEE